MIIIAYPWNLNITKVGYKHCMLWKRLQNPTYSTGFMKAKPLKWEKTRERGCKTLEKTMASHPKMQIKSEMPIVCHTE